MRTIFDLGAVPYDLITANDHWRASVRRMAALLPPGPIGLGLDLGAGPGTSTLVLREARPDARWVAADLSPAMLERARRRIAAAGGGAAARAPALVCADALGLPFRDGAFGAALAHSLLYLVPSRAAALGEAFRVLRPGAAFVYLEPHPEVPLPALAAFVARNALAPRFAASMLAWRVAGRTHCRVDPERSTALARAAGFREVAVHATLGPLGYFVVARK